MFIFKIDRCGYQPSQKSLLLPCTAIRTDSQMSKCRVTVKLPSGDDMADAFMNSLILWFSAQDLLVMTEGGRAPELPPFPEGMLTASGG